MRHLWWLSLLPIGACLEVIGGYLPEYRIDVDVAALLLTDLMLFSIDPLDASNYCCLNEHHWTKIERDLDRGKTRLWLTLGGAGRSQGLVQWYRNEKEPDWDHWITLAQNHSVYGIDWDCESFGSMEDYYAWIGFLNRAVRRLQDAGLASSITLHPRQFLPSYDLFDRIHLMAYEQGNAVQAVELLMQSGCPADKIVLGIAAYGSHDGAIRTLYEIADAGWPADARYEDPKKVHRLVEWAHNKGLKGVFVWEVGQDYRSEEYPGGVLLEAIADAVRGLQQTKSDEL